MEQRKRGSVKKYLWVSIALSCVIALLGAVSITTLQTGTRLTAACENVAERYTSIMDSYTHSFLLLEKLVQQEIVHAADADEIEAYLKAEDSPLQEAEGDDYDGVYLYYQGRYLYSWDTPHSVYDESGYNATQRPWYLGAVAAGGGLFVTVPYPSYANDYMLATISRLQPDGQTVIAYDIKLGAIQNFVSRLDPSDDSLTLICDRAGNIIGSTEPLYSGGNYLLSEAELDQNVSAAQQELQTADTHSARGKAEKKLQSMQALKSFCTARKDALVRLSADPGALRFDFHNLSVGYACDNGQSVCFKLVPLVKLLPQAAFLWMVLFLILALASLLMESVALRLSDAKEIRQKNGQLAAAVARADAASTAKSQFLAQMSHEIRTPMNAIIGLTNIARAEVSSPEKVKTLFAKSTPAPDFCWESSTMCWICRPLREAS